MHDTQYAAANEVENSELGQPERLFGICQAVGDHMGFNPIFLRIGLIGLLFFGPALMFGAYFGLGRSRPHRRRVPPGLPEAAGCRRDGRACRNRRTPGARRVPFSARARADCRLTGPFRQSNAA